MEISRGLIMQKNVKSLWFNNQKNKQGIPDSFQLPKIGLEQLKAIKEKADSESSSSRTEISKFNEATLARVIY
ncbi:MAG: hypothetical protein ACI9NA_000588 [Gammaproteobacteria bacterium]|jgi:hypothetical protein|nr:hypothetical protein CN03_02605 [Thalassolituus oleivorans]